jgi:hypothetical protein
MVLGHWYASLFLLAWTPFLGGCWFGRFELLGLGKCEFRVGVCVLRGSWIEPFHLFETSIVLFQVLGFAPLVRVRGDPFLQALDLCLLAVVLELFGQDRRAFGSDEEGHGSGAGEIALLWSRLLWLG